jgi:cytochrome c biogenesis factor
MRIVRIAAVVLAILGGAFALLGFATVVRDWAGTVSYGWFLFVSVLVIGGGGVAILSRPRDGSKSEDYSPNLGKTLFWIGIVLLDVLFVLFVLWLFVPSLNLSHRVFSSRGGTLAMVMLDVGIAAVLVGYSRNASVTRL